jgi:sulfite reductase (NADPH) flavoprotein alpha-component
MSIPLARKFQIAVLPLKQRQRLNASQSSKEVFHIVLKLEEANVHFEPGDCVAILPENDHNLVEKILGRLSYDATTLVKDLRSDQRLPLKEFLVKKVNLSRLTSSFLKLTPQLEETFSDLLKEENRSLLTHYLQSRDVLDFLSENGASFSLESFCAAFSPLLPRFYSIASSPKTHPDEIHLLVSVSSFSHKSEIRLGVASHFLCHLATPGETRVPLYIQKAAHFHLPENRDCSLIMIGPGTGIAPFRAFLQERRETGSLGKNWLFFGEREERYDFLYETELKKWVAENHLQLDCAFSRDQPHKVYVQHKMYEARKKLWNWLQEGSYLYICGEADPMSKEVQAILQRIAQEEGTLSAEDAKLYLRQLQKEKRLRIDVY